MSKRLTERFYVETCTFWQARVSRKEFWSVVDEIIQDRLYAEVDSDSVTPKVPFIVNVFREHFPDGLIHTDYILVSVHPYEPTGKDGYITRVYIDNELMQ